MAMCAMIDALYYFQTAGSAGASVSVGSVSSSVGQGAQPDCTPKAQAAELLRCARLYLDVYRGAGHAAGETRAPVDYSLCNQTVTLYHADLSAGFVCQRTVFAGAFLDFKKVQTVTRPAAGRQTAFYWFYLPGVAAGWYGPHRRNTTHWPRLIGRAALPCIRAIKCCWERGR